MGRWKIENVRGKVTKWGEDFRTFFFSLFTFQNHWNLFWLYQNGNFLSGKGISSREKIRKNNFASSEKYSSYASGVVYGPKLERGYHVYIDYITIFDELLSSSFSFISLQGLFHHLAKYGATIGASFWLSYVNSTSEKPSSKKSSLKRQVTFLTLSRGWQNDRRPSIFPDTSKLQQPIQLVQSFLENTTITKTMNCKNYYNISMLFWNSLELAERYFFSRRFWSKMSSTKSNIKST